MIHEFINKELEKKSKVVIHESIKFILRSPKSKECCVWFKRRESNAAHQPMENSQAGPNCNLWQDHTNGEPAYIRDI